MKYLIKSTLIIVATFITLNVDAQKLPNIQSTALRAPASVKIDGKTTEWDNQFKAYNKTTEVYYTMANDTNNLYLVLKATDKVIIRKIISNSFTFAITKTDNNKKDFSITLPLFVEKDKVKLLGSFYTKADENIDSLVRAVNPLLDKAKEFKISGFDGITDATISVYNDHGIKAKALFDNTRSLTYELAIPLKYIGKTIDKLGYNLTLNGVGTNDKNLTITTTDGGMIITNQATGSLTVMKNSPETLAISSATDFSGNYELAK